MKKIPFKHITDVMEKIIKNHTRDTIQGSELTEIKGYKYNILEKTFFSKALFSKKGVEIFIKILELMKKKGVKKDTGKPLTEEEQVKIDQEIQELKKAVENFKTNPHHESELLRDRIAAKDFAALENIN